MSRLQNTSTHSTGSILPDLSSLQQIPNASGNPNDGASNSSNNGLGSSSTTAGCMVILFSITGIITALFLIIIGWSYSCSPNSRTIRPQKFFGKTSTSRAKGLASAMLETLPIVKFNDQNEKPAPDGDNVEFGQTVVTAGDGAPTRGSDPQQR